MRNTLGEVLFGYSLPFAFVHHSFIDYFLIVSIRSSVILLITCFISVQYTMPSFFPFLSFSKCIHCFWHYWFWLVPMFQRNRNQPLAIRDTSSSHPSLPPKKLRLSPYPLTLLISTPTWPLSPLLISHFLTNFSF